VTEDTETLRDRIAAELIAARGRTTLLTTVVDEADLVRQHSPLMSPLVWDLAHVANQEELWLLREVGGRTPLHPEIDPLYDAFEHPRAKRPALPLLAPDEARGYGHEVRGRVLDLLERTTFGETQLTDGGFAFGMIAQHEAQHDETMLATHQLRSGLPVLAAAAPAPAPADASSLPVEVLVPGGPFTMGTSTEAWALDNERPAHVVHVPAFYLDTTPVTNSAYAEFIADGGYDDPRWGTPDGWAHRPRAGMLERVVERVDLRVQRVPAADLAQQPQLLLVRDVREVPHQRGHQRRVLLDQVRLIHCRGEQGGAVARRDQFRRDPVP